MSTWTRESALAFIEARPGDSDADAIIRDLAAEVARLRDGLDTIDWLLHVDRLNKPGRLTTGATVKRDVTQLVRSVLGDEWLRARRIPA